MKLSYFEQDEPDSDDINLVQRKAENMSMSTNVVGFAPPDEKYRRMKAIWDACKAADIKMPGEVNEFFDGQEPDPQGVEVIIKHKKWSDDMRDGIEVEIAALPPHVKVIRFYTAW